MDVIEPTVGRVVHYYTTVEEADKPNGLVYDHPHAAIVTAVHDTRMVNLVVFGADGNSYPRTSVPLVQPEDVAPEFGSFCSWMPYQVGQAQKTEQLQEQLSSGVGTSK